MKARTGLIALLIASSVAYVCAADWPAYLGPRRDGTSTETGLLRSWPNEGPKVLWTAPVGIGYGGPVVSAGKVYLLDRDDAVGDTLRCLDFATGKELWNFTYKAPGRFDHPGSRTTPTVDGDLVYTFGPLGDLYAISTTTHKPVLEQERLEGLWRRRAAPVGVDPEPPRVSQPGHGGSAERRGRA